MVQIAIPYAYGTNSHTIRVRSYRTRIRVRYKILVRSPTDILLLEHVQRRATKYILNDYTSSYKSRLTKLNLLPLMCIYELHHSHNLIIIIITSLRTT